MKTHTDRFSRRRHPALALLTLVVAMPFLTPTIFGQTASPKPADTGKPAAGPSEEEMMQMMELSKLNENHKQLADLVGTWDYTVKMWMTPDGPPNESKGVAVRKPMMDGRYFTLDVEGKFDMPGPDGKMQTMDFKGVGTEGYDNAKKKFVSTWVDNMGTGVMYAEGTYDPATKTYTYDAEYEMLPGKKTNVREMVKVMDKDHHVFEFLEERGGKFVKTMEINYTRRK